MTRRTVLAATGAVLAMAWIAVIAIGSAKDDPVRARDGRITVTMDDFRFSVERIRTRPGPFRMEVRNEGRVPHAVQLVRARTGGEAGRVITRRPGESGVLEVEKVNRGRYRYLCPLPQHEDLGMYGELIVR